MSNTSVEKMRGNNSTGLLPESHAVLDDDGRAQRTGSVYTAIVVTITAAFGSAGLLPLAWAIAQLGWVAGPAVILLFSIVAYYTSALLSQCYNNRDLLNGQRNYTYTDAVSSSLGGMQKKIFVLLQYLNMFGITIGYTITSSMSMMAIMSQKCFHQSGGVNPCHSANPYMLAFGIVQIIFSQIPIFYLTSWFHIVAAVMSFTYTTIGLGLGIAKVAENHKIGGSVTGIDTGAVTQAEKIWKSFQALGDIAFLYSFPWLTIEIQDMLKSPPSTSSTMKRAARMSVIVTTFFYMLYGCIGYAAFGDAAPRDLLKEVRIYNPFWVIKGANIAIVTNLVIAYQVNCQPQFIFTEKCAASKFPHCGFITKEIIIPIPGHKPYNLNLFRLVWRTIFVSTITAISMLFPSDDMARLLVALAFWPMAAYYPVAMYISQGRTPKWSREWWALQILSVGCLVFTIAAAVGSVAGFIYFLKG